MKMNRSSRAAKAAAVIMALILAAVSVTACSGNTGGNRTRKTDSTRQTTDDTAGVSDPETVDTTGSETDDTTVVSDPETENTTGRETVNTDDGSRRYATDYPIDVKEQKSDFFDDWSIWKRQENGMIFLQISNSGFHERETDIEYLLFWVYDSEEDAKKAYEGYYDKSKEFDKGRFWEEGTDWFLSEEPGVMDASIVWINYREGNVIISAHLGSTSKWAEVKETGTGSEDYHPLILKNYVLENSEDIRTYVIDVIMEA